MPQEVLILAVPMVQPIYQEVMIIDVTLVQPMHQEEAIVSIIIIGIVVMETVLGILITSVVQPPQEAISDHMQIALVQPVKNALKKNQGFLWKKLVLQ